MRKFLLVAAVLALAACGEKKADDGMSDDAAPTTEMSAPAATTTDSGMTSDSGMKADTGTMKDDSDME